MCMDLCSNFPHFRRLSLPARLITPTWNSHTTAARHHFRMRRNAPWIRVHATRKSWCPGWTSPSKRIRSISTSVRTRALTMPWCWWVRRDWSIDSLIGWVVVDWLVDDWLIDWLVDWLNWLINWWGWPGFGACCIPFGERLLRLELKSSLHFKVDLQFSLIVNPTCLFMVYTCTRYLYIYGK